ncbi:MAG: FRG domain-containing protein [Acidobacteriaceae bacterium]
MPTPADWSEKLQAFLNTWKQNPRSDEYLGDGPFIQFVLTEQAASWDDFLIWLRELEGSWCFRGQREAAWLLNTSLDLAVKREYSSENSSGSYHLDRETEGRELLFRFQQQAHSYIAHPPPSEDLSSWFALMQHHGVPTRLLDWTSSPYVALFFALEEQTQEKDGSSALWAVDMDWLERKGRELLPPQPPAATLDGSETSAEYINGLLRETEQPVIVKINPRRANERMFAQQGVFLCKLFHPATFGLILMSMMIHPQPPARPVVRKLELGTNLRIEFLKNLRAMNVHRASLFPGIDGFGRSLKLDLEIKVKSGED